MQSKIELSSHLLIDELFHQVHFFFKDQWQLDIGMKEAFKLRMRQKLESVNVLLNFSDESAINTMVQHMLELLNEKHKKSVGLIIELFEPNQDKPYKVYKFNKNSKTDCTVRLKKNISAWHAPLEEGRSLYFKDSNPDSMEEETPAIVTIYDKLDTTKDDFIGLIINALKVGNERVIKAVIAQLNEEYESNPGKIELSYLWSQFHNSKRRELLIYKQAIEREKDDTKKNTLKIIHEMLQKGIVSLLENVDFLSDYISHLSHGRVGLHLISAWGFLRKDVSLHFWEPTKNSNQLNSMKHLSCVRNTTINRIDIICRINGLERLEQIPEEKLEQYVFFEARDKNQKQDFKLTDDMDIVESEPITSLKQMLATKPVDEFILLGSEAFYLPNKLQDDNDKARKQTIEERIYNKNTLITHYRCDDETHKQKFQDQLNELIDTLEHIVSKIVGDDKQKSELFKKAAEAFKNNIFSPEYSGKQTTLFFDSVKNMLEIITLHLLDSDLRSQINIIANLEDCLGVCVGGMYTKLCDIYYPMTKTDSIYNWLGEFRHSIFQKLVPSFVKSSNTNQSVHVANSLCSYARNMGLNIPGSEVAVIDEFAKIDELTAEDFARFHREFKDRYTPASIVFHIGGCLIDFINKTYKSYPGQYESFSNVLNDLLVPIEVDAASIIDVEAFYKKELVVYKHSLYANIVFGLTKTGFFSDLFAKSCIEFKIGSAQITYCAEAPYISWVKSLDGYKNLIGWCQNELNKLSSKELSDLYDKATSFKLDLLVIRLGAFYKNSKNDAKYINCREYLRNHFDSNESFSNFLKRNSSTALTDMMNFDMVDSSTMLKVCNTWGDVYALFNQIPLKTFEMYHNKILGIVISSNNIKNLCSKDDASAVNAIHKIRAIFENSSFLWEFNTRLGAVDHYECIESGGLLLAIYEERAEYLMQQIPKLTKEGIKKLFGDADRFLEWFDDDYNDDLILNILMEVCEKCPELWLSESPVWTKETIELLFEQCVNRDDPDFYFKVPKLLKEKFKSLTPQEDTDDLKFNGFDQGMNLQFVVPELPNFDDPNPNPQRGFVPQFQPVVAMPYHFYGFGDYVVNEREPEPEPKNKDTLKNLVLTIKDIKTLVDILCQLEPSEVSGFLEMLNTCVMGKDAIQELAFLKPKKAKSVTAYQMMLYLHDHLSSLDKSLCYKAVLKLLSASPQSIMTMIERFADKKKYNDLLQDPERLAFILGLLTKPKAYELLQRYDHKKIHTIITAGDETTSPAECLSELLTNLNYGDKLAFILSFMTELSDKKFLEIFPDFKALKCLFKLFSPEKTAYHPERQKARSEITLKYISRIKGDCSQLKRDIKTYFDELGNCYVSKDQLQNIYDTLGERIESNSGLLRLFDKRKGPPDNDKESNKKIKYE